MQRNLFIVLLFTLFTFSLTGQSIFEGKEIKINSSAIDAQFSDYKIVELNVAAINQYVKNSGASAQFNLHINDELSWEVDIYPKDIRSEDYQLVLQTEEGRKIGARTANKTYRGHNIGAASGIVRLTIDDNFFYGLIGSGEKTYFIEPAWAMDAALNQSLYVVYEEGDVLDRGHSCGTDHSHHHMGEQIPKVEDESRMMMACYRVPVALAADFSMFQQFGGVTNTENFMVGVLNNVQTNYDNEFNNEIEFSVAGFFISTCSGCDPWTSSNDAGTLLDSFTNWGNAGNFGFSYSLASLWTDRDFNGGTIGVAWVGGLCSSLEYNTLQNFSTNAALLRVLQAHEFGHNFNSGHDPSGSPTIMAPSVNTSNSWSIASQNVINNFIDFKAQQSNCFFPCTSGSEPPIAAIVAPVTHICPGSIIPFIDGSQNNPTSWDWDFQGGLPSTSSDQNPMVQYPDEGIYIVTLTVENSAGVDVAVLNEDIRVDQDGTKYLMYETFENGLGAWTVANSDNNVTWETSQVGGTQYGTRAAFVNNFDYNAPGQVDGLISPTLSFSGESGLTFQMDYAYRRFNVSNSDQLRISISTNGGATYPDVLFFGQETGGGNFATGFDSTNDFTPSAQSDWCYAGSFGPGCITLDLSDYAGENNVKIKIENINDFGNNMYVDNIRITGNCQPTTPPVASFLSDVTEGCAPLTVQYEDVSFGAVENWEWSFPGGTPSTSFEPNPVVTYNMPGIYDVSLTVYNAAGADQSSLPGYINVLGPPTPDFIYEVQDFTVNFTDLSIDANSINWNFGDGNTSNDAAPEHTYTEEGMYTVTLYTNNDCGTDSVSQIITIEAPIQAGMSADTLHGCPGLVVTYADTTEGDVTSWEWIFEGGIPATSMDQNPSVTYDTSGTFTTTLIVSNAMGTSDTLVQVDYIQIDSLPEAGFDVDYTLGETVVTFTNTSILANAYEWDFGDSATSTDANPMHDYMEDGEYMVTLIAMNDCGNDTITQLVTIVTLPTASFDLMSAAGCEPFTISPSSTASTNTDSLQWEATGAIPNISNDAEPEFVYDSAGVYTLYLIAFNEAGSDTTSMEITVGEEPEADYSYDYTIGNTSVDFDNQSTNADTYEWSFGEGGTSTEANPAYDFTTDGIYTVEMVAFNSCGSDTITYEIEIITAPTASFSVSNTNGCIPFAVMPQDASSTNTDSWNWDAPGANPSNSMDQAPTFTYDAPGTYTLWLIVSNEAGADTSTVDVTVGEEPSADYSFDSTIGSTNVAFDNQSSGANAYEWNFGDGNFSTEADPTHDFGTDGIYTVELVAFNDCGSDTIDYEIEIVTAPTASFSLNATDGCTPFVIMPQDASSANTDNWSWDAPGANPSSSMDQAPTFTYNTPGTYTLTLTVSNEAGTDTHSVDLTVGQGPSADFAYDYTIGTTTVNFNNLSAEANAYEWNFGDGNFSTETNPAHDFGTDGIYTVELVAFNDCSSDTIEYEIEITTAPTASFSLSDTDGCAPFVVMPQDASSANTDNWSWDAPGASPPNSMDQAPTFTYDAPGTYTLTLTVSNEAGSDVSTIDITVGEGPSADYSYDYTIGNTSVAFNNLSTNANNYEWHFGDGSMSVDASPTYNYSMDGIYNVQMVAHNDCGTDTVTYEVEIITAPVASFSLSETSGCAAFTVMPLDASSANTDNWSWDAPGADPSSSMDADPVFLYNTPGVYTLSLTVSNEAGMHTMTMDITVLDVPASDFSYQVNGVTVSLENQSANADSYTWHFGDGNSSDEENPTHEYQSVGDFIISLTAENACGTSMMLDTVSLSLDAPVANFVVENNVGCAPLEVSFNNVSENATSYMWTFDGGMPATSTEEHPTVTYDAPGIYSATLLAINPAGSGALTQMDIVVVNNTPQADFLYDIDGATVNFTNNSQDGGEYAWLFGDGEGSAMENPTHTYSAGGEYEVILLATNDCGIDTSTQLIVLEGEAPVPGISVHDSVGCAPFTITYFSTVTGGEATTYEWTFEGGTPETSTDPNPEVLYETAGVYTVQLTTTNAFGSNSIEETDIITVLDTPEASFTSEQIGPSEFSFTSMVSGGGNLEYSWDFGDGNGSNEADPVHLYEQEGIFTVELTVSNECGEVVATGEVEIVIDRVIDESWLQYLNVYPNPNAGQFVLEIKAPASDRIQARLINVIGQSLYEVQDDFHTGYWNHHFQLNKLPAGVYILEVKAGEQKAYRRVVVE